MGVLNAWKWPNIERLHSFKGTLLHSANYDNSVDNSASLVGKTVAVIGSGSSGIQIIPAIQPEVKKIGASKLILMGKKKFGSQYIKKDAKGEPIYEYSPEERDLLKNNPAALLEYRRILENFGERRFKSISTLCARSPLSSSSSSNPRRIHEVTTAEETRTCTTFDSYPACRMSSSNSWNWVFGGTLRRRRRANFFFRRYFSCHCRWYHHLKRRADKIRRDGLCHWV